MLQYVDSAGNQVFPRGSVGWRQGAWIGGPGLDPYCWLGLAGRGGEGLRVN